MRGRFIKNRNACMILASIVNFSQVWEERKWRCHYEGDRRDGRSYAGYDASHDDSRRKHRSHPARLLSNLSLAQSPLLPGLPALHCVLLSSAGAPQVVTSGAKSAQQKKAGQRNIMPKPASGNTFRSLH